LEYEAIHTQQTENITGTKGSQVREKAIGTERSAPKNPDENVKQNVFHKKLREKTDSKKTVLPTRLRKEFHPLKLRRIPTHEKKAPTRKPAEPRQKEGGSFRIRSKNWDDEERREKKATDRVRAMTLKWIPTTAGSKSYEWGRTKNPIVHKLKKRRAKRSNIRRRKKKKVGGLKCNHTRVGRGRAQSGKRRGIGSKT